MANDTSLEQLSQRLDVLKTELAHFEKQRGDPENAPLVRKLRAVQVDLSRRAAEARARGDTWDMIGFQLLRDFEALEAEVAASIVRGADVRDEAHD